MKRTVSRGEKAYAKKIGAWIREQRIELGVSVQAFAGDLGVHRNTVGRWEAGRALPNVYHYILIRRRVSGVEVVQ